MHTADQKAALRQAIKERLLRMTEKQREAESRTIVRTLLQRLPAEPSVVCAYYPLSDEPDIRSLLQELIGRGCEAFLPSFNRETMTMRRMPSLTSLKPGLFDILQPPPDAPLADPSRITHVLVPGRAFDATGARLGRGNGGYDRWIADQRKRNPSTAYWGIAFDVQLVSDVPREEWDQRMDALVLPHGFKPASR